MNANEKSFLRAFAKLLLDHEVILESAEQYDNKENYAGQTFRFRSANSKRKLDLTIEDLMGKRP